MTEVKVPAALAALAGDELYVSEVFGPTVQGEGPNTGRRAYFVRLGGCNLTCRGCDTPYTWDASRYRLRDEIRPWRASSVAAAVAGARLVVITGGEPLIHQQRPGLPHLVRHLVERGADVQFETNGTIVPREDMCLWPGVSFVVSPKLSLPMATDPSRRRLVPAALARFSEYARLGRADFKIVLSTPSDLVLVEALVDAYRVPRDRVWIMPEGADADTSLRRGRELADAAIRRGFNVSPRLHLLLWPTEERGR